MTSIFFFKTLIGFHKRIVKWEKIIPPQVLLHSSSVFVVELLPWFMMIIERHFVPPWKVLHEVANFIDFFHKSTPLNNGSVFVALLTLEIRQKQSKAKHNKIWNCCFPSYLRVSYCNIRVQFYYGNFQI